MTEAAKISSDLHRPDVSVHFSEAREYHTRVPFDPPESYPEYEGSGTDDGNKVYGAVRETLRSLGMDAANFGTPAWDPFGEIVSPGMTVFIKPNTVRHYHTAGKDVLAIINHASALRPVIDYTLKALKGEGRIIIGDSQVMFGEFDKAHKVALIDQLVDWYRGQTGVPIECFDLRTVRGVRTYLYGKWGRKKVEQDPRGYRFVDLGSRSCFEGIDPARLRVAIASHKNMYKHHSGGRHEYLFPKSVLDADAVISIAKLKTHRRTAVTLMLKNFMGIPALKDSLPHFQTGSVAEGGDQYINPSARKRICTGLHDVIQSSPYIPVKFACAVTKKIVWNSHRLVPFKDDVYEAMWHGNDTLWRTLIDLTRGVVYADRDGKIQDTPQRNFFGLIDGIIGCEKNGPVGGDPVAAGVFLAGYNPVTLDAAGSALMGFDVEKIPMIRKAFSDGAGSGGSIPLFRGTPDRILVHVDDEVYGFRQFGEKYNLCFEPHPGWKNFVERH